MPGSAGRFAIPKLASAAAGGLLAAALLAVGPPASATGTITINGGTTYQTITGFGASEGFGEASALLNSGGASTALNYLFGQTGGAGLTILRNEISADSGSTIEPNAPSSPSATPTYLPLSSIGNDQGQLTLAQDIKSQYGVTNVFADAWSAPAFMKVNNSTSGGTALCGLSGATCSSGNWVQAYANYLKQYAADYAAAGVPLTYIGPENEANLSTSYDSMQLSPAQTAQFLDTLGPTMASSGLSTKVECCATEGWDYAQQYASAIEADSTANADTAVFTSHGYTAAPTSPLSGWSKPAWETEWSTFESWNPAWDDGSDASGLTWAQHIFAGLDSANLSAFLYWWGSGTPSENNDNESLILINGSTVTPSGRLWAFANFSDYVRPGAVRIGASSSDGNITVDAFKNTSNNTIAIVALNTGTSSDTNTYSLTGTGVANGATVTPHLTNSSSNDATQATTSVSSGSFSYTIPARSLATFVIPSGSGNGNTVTVTNPGAHSSTVGTATSLQISASDSAAGQTLTYSATGLPPGLSINSSTGLISGTPTTAGTYSVTVAATDTTGASGSASFTWTVGTTGNTVTVTNPGTQTGTVGTAASLQIHASDSATGQTLTYSATGLPAGLSINSSTGLISGTPTASGSSSVTVTATDGTGASGTASFTWTIGTSGGGGTCQVVYTLNSSWPGGFTAQVVITNTGTTTINGWSLTFTFPGDEKITSNFNGGFSQSGENATLTNASYNGTIAPGANITDGFQGTWTSSVANPTSFSLNGTACTT
jgi:O-glycosyl hydrolase